MHIGIAKMRNHGEIITFTIIAEPQRRTKNISRWIDMDIFLSMTPISVLNLFKIFPTGLESKNDIGTLRSLDMASSCNFLLALAPVH